MPSSPLLPSKLLPPPRPAGRKSLVQLVADSPFKGLDIDFEWTGLWPRRCGMSGFLLDTNIPSKLTRQQSSPQVERWLDLANDEELYFSVISLGEIVKGITILPASKRRDGLQDWLDGTLRPWFEDRILPVTAPIAERWGVLSGEYRCRENRSGSLTA